MAQQFTDEELLGYFDIHSRTERALFHKDHLAHLLRLAGREEQAQQIERHPRDFWTCYHEDVKHLIQKGRVALVQQGINQTLAALRQLRDGEHPYMVQVEEILRTASSEALAVAADWLQEKVYQEVSESGYEEGKFTLGRSDGDKHTREVTVLIGGKDPEWFEGLRAYFGEGTLKFEPLGPWCVTKGHQKDPRNLWPTVTLTLEHRPLAGR